MGMIIGGDNSFVNLSPRPILVRSFIKHYRLRFTMYQQWTTGTLILLVHGFPETWCTFRKLIPLLAENHHVFAVDLRGFGDSDNGPGNYNSKTCRRLASSH
ncbi:alpha/beta fold hydrolase [Paenibacillus rhizosphaerae]|uniref:alpha/beta fold hydrolase n=1 Tax=Paenibacillus rhizosphaerae TaxID=297318 RepID=UPI0035E4083C